MVVRFDVLARVQYASRNAMEFFPIPREDHVGKSPRDLGFPESLATLFHECIRKVLESAHPVDREFTLPGPNGDLVLEGRFAPEFDPGGRVGSVLSIFRDLTVQRQVEKDYDVLFKEMLEGFVHHEAIRDKEGRIIDFRFLSVNPAAAKNLGKAAEELVGRTIFELFPDAEPYWLEAYVKVVETGESITFENYSAFLGRWFHVTAFRTMPEQFATIVSDITDRIRAQEELHESRERMQALLNSMKDLVFVLDHNLVFQSYYQPEGDDLYVPPEQFLGRRVDEVGFPEEFTGPLIRTLEETLRTDQPSRLEYWLDLPRGRAWFDLSITTFKVDEKSPPGLTCVVREITRLKQVELDLKAKKEELDRYFTSSLDMLCIASIEGRFLRLNPEWEKVLGYKLEELEGMRFLDLVHPYDLDATLQAIADLADQREILNFENRYRCKDGSYRWIEWRSIPKDNLIYAAARDITDRKNTEQTLLLAREQFELAVLGSNDGIWDWDIRDDSLFLSQRWKEQLGYQPDELQDTFETFKVRIHPGDVDRVMDYLERYLRGEMENYNIEFRMRHKDGIWRWILARGTAVRNEEGIPVRMAGSHTDITERKRAEAELLRHNELQELLTSISSTYISLPLAKVDEAIETSLGELGRFVHADRAYLFRYDMENRTFTNTHEWCAPDIDPAMDECQELSFDLLPEMTECHFSGRFFELKDPDELPPGSESRKQLDQQGIKSLVTVPLLDGERCLGFTGFDYVRRHHTHTQADLHLLTVFAQMMTNIQKRQEIEEALRLSREQADAANRAKSEFLANMSHEIRTPMNGVIGMINLLLDTPLTQIQKQYAETVRASGETLLAILNDILDFSKIEAGRMDLETVGFRLRRTIEVSLEPLILKARNKGVEFVSSISPDIPDSLLGDPIRFRQILLNLVGNAVKFTSEGEIVLRCDLVSEDEGMVVLKFSVRDTGIGVPREKMEVLFEQFSQGDPSTTRQYGGTGLGLAIARQLVELMGGDIGLHSEARNGSTFWFTARFGRDSSIPAESPTIIRPDIKNQRAHVGNDKGNTRILPHLPHRILLVEDNEVNRMVAIGMLGKMVTSITIADSGIEALDILKRESFDLVFMDIQMPGMDGYETTRQIRSGACQINTGVVIIAMTAHAMKGDREKCLEAGMNDYISKPISRSALDVLLTKWLPQSSHDITPGE